LYFVQKLLEGTVFYSIFNEREVSSFFLFPYSLIPYAKRDLRTYAKSVDPDQLPRLRCRDWSGFALFDNRHNNVTTFPCCVYIFIMNRCLKHRKGADLGLHYVKCPNVPFRVTPAICKQLGS